MLHAITLLALVSHYVAATPVVIPPLEVPADPVSKYTTELLYAPLHLPNLSYTNRLISGS